MRIINIIIVTFLVVKGSVFSQEYTTFRISKSLASYDLTGWTPFNGYKLSFGITDYDFGFYASYEHGVNDNSQDFFRMKHVSGDDELAFDTLLNASSKAHTVSFEGVYYFTDQEKFLSLYSSSSINFIFISSRKTKEANLLLPFGYEVAKQRVNGLGITFGAGLGLNFRLHEQINLFVEVKYTMSEPDLELDINGSLNLNGGVAYSIW